MSTCNFSFLNCHHRHIFQIFVDHLYMFLEKCLFRPLHIKQLDHVLCRLLDFLLSHGLFLLLLFVLLGSCLKIPNIYHPGQNY